MNQINNYIIPYNSINTNSGINKVYTKAVYDICSKGKKLRFESNFISIIDIPYKRYRLE